MIHCIKSVRIRCYSSPHFSLIRTEYGEKRSISPYSIRMRENARKMPTRITSNTDAFYAVIVFIFIGNLDISRLVSALPLVSLLTLQKFYFLLAKFVLKKQNIYVQYTSVFFLILSYSASITLIQLLISLQFLIHPFRDVHWCSSKNFICIFGGNCSLAFPNSCTENIWKLPVKHSCWNAFQVHLQGFKNLFRAAMLQTTCQRLLL